MCGLIFLPQASIFLFLLGREAGAWRFFASTSSGNALGQMVQSLLRKGAFDLAPLSSRGYYCRFVYIRKSLGSWRPILNFSLLSRIHHPEGSVSAFSDTSVFRILSSVHGVWQSFFQFLALCLGLSTAPQVFKRVMAPVRSFFFTVLDSASALSARLAHSGVLPGVDFLSLRTFLWLCKSLGIVVDWEMSQLVAH